jgi:hypothetical protein
VADEEKKDPAAPHGYDDEGVPLAPFGYKANGDPKLSNRGRVAGPGKKSAPNTKSGVRPKSRTQAQTKAQLIELGSIVTTPLAVAADNSLVRKRIGDRHAAALAGDAVIIEMYTEPIVDLVMFTAQTKPGILAWMDKAEDAAPLIMAAKVFGGLAKALVQNHLNPDERLARAGRTMVQVKAAKYAAAIEAEAAAMGLVDDDVAHIPQQRAA